MTSYTINKLAHLAGVSTRTLHYYDQISLLKPSFIADNGYRYYGEEKLIRLQQILFYRELGFALEQIKPILDNPVFDVAASLHDHRRILEAEQQRIGTLIKTVDKTIKKLQGERRMTDEELYEGFTREEAEQYQKEAKERWGQSEAYKQSVERVKKLSKAELEQVKQEGVDITAAIAKKAEEGLTPSHPDVQALVKRHHAHIGRFYDCSLTIYNGLGRMYVDDARFAAYYEKFRPGLARYMADAIGIYCGEAEKKD